MVADLVSPEAICGYRFVTAEASDLLDPVGLLAAAGHVDHAMGKSWVAMRGSFKACGSSCVSRHDRIV